MIFSCVKLPAYTDAVRWHAEHYSAQTGEGHPRLLRRSARPRLQSVETSKTVRKRKGKVVMTDGPFAETKEQLLGFVMLEAESLDEALKIAGDIPIAEWGTIEVRAVYAVPER
jgi:hypothetical protein